MSENSNSVGRGVVSTILFGKETSYGTGGTAAKDIGLVQTCTISPDSTTEERFGAGQANSVYVKGGLVNVKGSVEAEYQHARPLEWGFYGGTTTHADTRQRAHAREAGRGGESDAGCFLSIRSEVHATVRHTQAPTTRERTKLA